MWVCFGIAWKSRVVGWEAEKYKCFDKRWWEGRRTGRACRSRLPATCLVSFALQALHVPRCILRGAACAPSPVALHRNHTRVDVARRACVPCARCHLPMISGKDSCIHPALLHQWRAQGSRTIYSGIRHGEGVLFIGYSDNSRSHRQRTWPISESVVWDYALLPTARSTGEVGARQRVAGGCRLALQLASSARCHGSFSRAARVSSKEPGTVSARAGLDSTAHHRLAVPLSSCCRRRPGGNLRMRPAQQPLAAEAMG